MKKEITLSDLISENPTAEKPYCYRYKVKTSGTTLGLMTVRSEFFAKDDATARMAMDILTEGDTPISLCRIDPQTARLIKIVWRRTSNSTHNA